MAKIVFALEVVDPDHTKLPAVMEALESVVTTILNLANVDDWTTVAVNTVTDVSEESIAFAETVSKAIADYE